VAKRVDAPYRAGRQPAWVKIKNRDYSRRAAVEWQGSLIENPRLRTERAHARARAERNDRAQRK